MPRLLHGSTVSLQRVKELRTRLQDTIASFGLTSAVAPQPDLQRFDYLFPELQNDPEALLPESPETVAALKRLGASMRDAVAPGSPDSDIPAAYTYLGQFIDHDITLEAVSGNIRLDNPNLAPLPLATILNDIRNTRTAALDLDSVYDAPAPSDPDDPRKMLLGRVSTVPPAGGVRPPGKVDQSDLPREGRSGDINHDRAALTGDPRNDENLIVAQLHVAFLKAHNVLVDRTGSREEARTLLRQHYQWIVLHDFLPRIADPDVVTDVLQKGNRFYQPSATSRPFFLPFEYSVAAYRFGHTLVRDQYDFNLNFGPNGPIARGSLDLLFTFTALSGQLGGFETLPENWIIEWERFVDTGALTNPTRPIDTQIVEPLERLRFPDGTPLPDEARLAVRNLLRGYLLRLPTGQAVAKAMGETPLSPAELIAVASRVTAGAEPQAKVLEETGLAEKTPLWFYVLAEAAHSGKGRLGPVGSRIVAEVLTELIRQSSDSILLVENWQPTLGATAGEFRLPDLLRLADVLR